MHNFPFAFDFGAENFCHHSADEGDMTHELLLLELDRVRLDFGFGAFHAVKFLNSRLIISGTLSRFLYRNFSFKVKSSDELTRAMCLVMF